MSGQGDPSISSTTSSSSSSSSPWRMFKRKASQELDKKSSNRGAAAAAALNDRMSDRMNDGLYPPTPPKSVESSSIRRSSIDSTSTHRSANSWKRQFETVRDGFEEHAVPKYPTPAPGSPMESTPSLATASTTSSGKSSSQHRNRNSTPLHPSYFQPTSMRPTSFIPPWFEFKYNNKDFPHKDYTGPKPNSSMSQRNSMVTGNDLNPTAVLPPKLDAAHNEIIRLHQQLTAVQQDLGRCKGQLSKANDEHCRIVDQVKRDVRAEVEQACREEFQEKIGHLYRQIENGQKNYRDSYQTLLDDYNRLHIENTQLRQNSSLTPDPESMASPRSDNTSLLLAASAMRASSPNPSRPPTLPSLESVREQFHELQKSIASLMEHLLTHIDPKKATALFTRAYPTLNLSTHLPDSSQSLSDFVILMLTEKLIMDTLMRDVFCVLLQPGVPIQSEYSTLKSWMEPLSRDWATLLRQHVCTLVWEDARTQREVDTQIRSITAALLEVLQLGFPSFIFSEQLQEIVSRAVKLSLAMQVQEEIVYPIHVQEGSDLFDPKRMLSITRGEKGLVTKDVPGNNMGSVVMFCICPPFIGGRKDDVVFAKGKVYCE